MKHILYLFLKNGPMALQAFSEIKEKGFNGTIIETASLRHALEDRFEDHPLFFSLSQWESMMNSGESTLSMYIVDDEHLLALKETIRHATGHFETIKGGMFSMPIENYEGTL
ncbi:MAG: hypothetical protein HUJ60_06610 [Bacilli bacterium]|mgnify:CR=1 FL=1|nr:hypothetical protein [Bacilli bacterium]